MGINCRFPWIFSRSSAMKQCMGNYCVMTVIWERANWREVESDTWQGPEWKGGWHEEQGGLQGGEPEKVSPRLICPTVCRCWKRLCGELQNTKQEKKHTGFLDHNHADVVASLEIVVLFEDMKFNLVMSSSRQFAMKIQGIDTNSSLFILLDLGSKFNEKLLYLVFC